MRNLKRSRFFVVRFLNYIEHEAITLSLDAKIPAAYPPAVKVLLLSLLLTSVGFGQLSKLHTAEQYELVIEALTAPAKLDTLTGKRAATPRLRKACCWIETARRGR